MTNDKPADATRQSAQRKTFRSGLAHCLVIQGENEAHIRAMIEFYESEFQPSGPTEDALITDLVACAWRLRRLTGIEPQLNAIIRKALEDPNDLCGKEASRAEKTLTNFTRYKTQLERSFNRALRELQRMRAQRAAALAPKPKKAAAPRRQKRTTFPKMTNIHQS